ncbi:MULTISPECIES: HAD family hydrolase [Halomonadaceae]|jgi:phosphoglycolate phosphatase|uniref:HAD family hydrolase n=1 Tax=Halomonadaceae TaxID=28256 RepID=UPI0012F11B72|nr:MULTISPECIES: HAD-IA family hydrolase [Halomonas]CAD5262564.1 HAD family hydrolase [Halomonas sp. 156]CAD5263465.1 putative phosphoglycolate phosphatase, clustered with ribosomal large subunit pseudouridine synthase C [Halomonas sp. I3]CAD5286219.1 HAD family hydrolase [Halomonas sp. 113]CAD5287798.1 HAD family hydrolase [Halomonas sp. 59]VXB36464.1 HAD family hydrolase [Halomonas titanicae]
MQYELIIFDWDGTLMDSVPRIVSCMQAAALEAEWGALTAAEVEDIIGLGLPEAIAQLCPGILPAQAERLRERYAHHFVQADATPMAFFGGVEAHIARLRGHEQQRLAVATGKSRRGLDRIFTETGSGAWFHASRTADETRSKPHPQMLSELLAELAVPVERAVMVGDTEYDLEMARAVGMDRVGVSYGVHTPERLAMSEPKWIAHSVDELFDRL